MLVTTFAGFRNVDYVKSDKYGPLQLLLTSRPNNHRQERSKGQHVYFSFQAEPKPKLVLHECGERAEYLWA